MIRESLLAYLPASAFVGSVVAYLIVTRYIAPRPEKEPEQKEEPWPVPPPSLLDMLGGLGPALRGITALVAMFVGSMLLGMALGSVGIRDDLASMDPVLADAHRALAENEARLHVIDLQMQEMRHRLCVVDMIATGRVSPDRPVSENVRMLSESCDRLRR